MPHAKNWSRPIDLGDRRILQPGPLRWVRALGWMTALFFLIVLTAYPLTDFLERQLPGNGAWPFLVHSAGAIVAILTYAVAVRLAEGRRPTELAPRPALAHGVAGLTIGAAVFTAVMTTMIVFGLYEVTWQGPVPAWRAAGLAIEAGVIEEIMVRAVVLRLLWRAFGPWAAFILSAAVFGASHLGNSDSSLFAAFCIAIEAGVMLGAFYALTGRLWVSIGVHAGWNFTQGYLFGAAVSGNDYGPALAKSVALQDVPAWLTGGAFGPEASLPGLLICAGVGWATVWAAYKRGRFTQPQSASPLSSDLEPLP